MMGRWARWAVAVVMLAGLGGTARAATADGVTYPDRYPVDGQTLVLNGMGVRSVTILSIRAYAVGLYLAQPSHDAAAILASNAPKVVLLQFLHSASKSQLADRYHEGEEKNCGHGECDPADRDAFERLIAITPPMAVGDTLAYVITGKGMTVLVNNRPIGSFTSRTLANGMVSGFIGPHAPTETLKRQLLGLGG